MIIKSFRITKSIEEARKEATSGLLTKLFMGKKLDDIVMRTMYIENRIITFEITPQASVLDRLLKRPTRRKQSAIEMIANGSTCGVAYYDRRGVAIDEYDVPEDEVQLSDFSDEDFIVRGNALARRILRRRVGGNMLLEVKDIESIYRPYHVAFFGKPEEGQKVRYIPIAADGCSVKRTF